MIHDHEQLSTPKVSPKRLEAFEACIREHGPFFRNFARRVDDTPESAEDLVQDALLDAWRGLGNFKGDSNLKTWIMKIMTNRVIDERRLRARRPVAANEAIEDFELAASTHTEPETAAEVNEKIGVLLEALAATNPGMRQAVLLRDFHGLSYEEIAAQSGTALNTTRWRIHVGRKTIAEAINEQAA